LVFFGGGLQRGRECPDGRLQTLQEHRDQPEFARQSRQSLDAGGIEDASFDDGGLDLHLAVATGEFEQRFRAFNRVGAEDEGIGAGQMGFESLILQGFGGAGDHRVLVDADFGVHVPEDAPQGREFAHAHATVFDDDKRRLVFGQGKHFVDDDRFGF